MFKQILSHRFIVRTVEEGRRKNKANISIVCEVLVNCLIQKLNKDVWTTCLTLCSVFRLIDYKIRRIPDDKVVLSFVRQKVCVV